MTNEEKKNAKDNILKRMLDLSKNYTPTIEQKDFDSWSRNGRPPKNQLDAKDIQDRNQILDEVGGMFDDWLNCAGIHDLALVIRNSSACIQELQEIEKRKDIASERETEINKQIIDRYRSRVWTDVINFPIIIENQVKKPGFWKNLSQITDKNMAEYTEEKHSFALQSTGDIFISYMHGLSDIKELERIHMKAEQIQNPNSKDTHLNNSETEFSPKKAHLKNLTLHEADLARN